MEIETHLSNLTLLAQVQDTLVMSYFYCLKHPPTMLSVGETSYCLQAFKLTTGDHFIIYKRNFMTLGRHNPLQPEDIIFLRSQKDYFEQKSAYFTNQGSTILCGPCFGHISMLIQTRIAHIQHTIDSSENMNKSKKLKNKGTGSPRPSKLAPFFS